MPCAPQKKVTHKHTHLWEVPLDDKHVISPGIVMVTWIYHFASRLQNAWILIDLCFINKHFPITFLHLQELQQDCTNSWPLLNGLLQWKGRWENAYWLDDFKWNDRSKTFKNLQSPEMLGHSVILTTTLFTEIYKHIQTWYHGDSWDTYFQSII